MLHSCDQCDTHTHDVLVVWRVINTVGRLWCTLEHSVQQGDFLLVSSFSDILTLKLEFISCYLPQISWAKREADVAVPVRECGVSIGKGLCCPAIACLPPPVRADLFRSAWLPQENPGPHGSLHSSSASWVSDCGWPDVLACSLSLIVWPSMQKYGLRNGRRHNFDWLFSYFLWCLSYKQGIGLEKMLFISRKCSFSALVQSVMEKCRRKFYISNSWQLASRSRLLQIACQPDASQGIERHRCHWAPYCTAGRLWTVLRTVLISCAVPRHVHALCVIELSCAGRL